MTEVLGEGSAGGEAMSCSVEVACDCVAACHTHHRHKALQRSVFGGLFHLLAQHAVGLCVLRRRGGAVMMAA
jgi:hypothetical protein